MLVPRVYAVAQTYSVSFEVSAIPGNVFELRGAAGLLIELLALEVAVAPEDAVLLFRKQTAHDSGGAVVDPAPVVVPHHVDLPEFPDVLRVYTSAPTQGAGGVFRAYDWKEAGVFYYPARALTGARPVRVAADEGVAMECTEAGVYAVSLTVTTREA